MLEVGDKVRIKSIDDIFTGYIRFFRDNDLDSNKYNEHSYPDIGMAIVVYVGCHFLNRDYPMYVLEQNDKLYVSGNSSNSLIKCSSIIFAEDILKNWK